MSEGDRNGDIARGLILGFLAGVLLCICAALFPVAVDVAPHGMTDCSATENDCSNNGEGVPDWRYWPRRLFALEDTLAQWIMMAFTIAATVVLGFTLRSANKTNVAAIRASEAALEANQIMRDEQRPWVTFEFQGEASIREGKVYAWINCTPQNIGKTPALDCIILAGGSEVQARQAEIRGAIHKGDNLSDWPGEKRIIFPSSSVLGAKTTPPNTNTAISFPLYETPPDNLLDIFCMVIYRSETDGEWLYTHQSVSVLVTNENNESPINCTSANELIFKFTAVQDHQVK